MEIILLYYWFKYVSKTYYLLFNLKKVIAKLIRPSPQGRPGLCRAKITGSSPVQPTTCYQCNLPFTVNVFSRILSRHVSFGILLIFLMIYRERSVVCGVTETVYRERMSEVGAVQGLVGQLL